MAQLGTTIPAGATVLVTGGSGFIGSHVIDQLAAAGYTPRIFDTRPSPWHAEGEIDTVIGDVCSLEDVLAASKGCAAICHLAAAADVSDVHARPAWSTELNSMGTLNVLEAARVHGDMRVVYSSTVWVYSDVQADTVDETTPLVPPAHLYTAGKLSGELYCRSYAELYDVPSTVVRFGIPYGPRARPAAVIPSFVDRARRGEALTIAGSGGQERSFVYVEDLANGVVRSLAPQAVGQTYNLGSDETTTIRELAEIVRDTVAPVEIVHTEGRPGDLRGATIRNDRAADELGWRASTPLAEGVARYTAWLVAEEQRTPVVIAPTPATNPAVAPTSTVAAPQAPRVGSRLAALVRDPLTLGAVSAIAIVSTLLPVLASTVSRTDAVGVTVVALFLLLSLWAVSNGRWTASQANLRGGIAAAIGVVGVGLATSLTPQRLGEIGHHRAMVMALVLSAALAVFQVVSSRNGKNAEDRTADGRA